MERNNLFPSSAAMFGTYKIFGSKILIHVASYTEVSLIYMGRDMVILTGNTFYG